MALFADKALFDVRGFGRYSTLSSCCRFLRYCKDVVIRGSLISQGGGGWLAGQKFGYKKQIMGILQGSGIRYI